MKIDSLCFVFLLFQICRVLYPVYRSVTQVSTVRTICPVSGNNMECSQQSVCVCVLGTEGLWRIQKIMSRS